MTYEIDGTFTAVREHTHQKKKNQRGLDLPFRIILSIDRIELFHKVKCPILTLL